MDEDGTPRSRAPGRMLPPRALPLVYFTAAHVSLLAALGLAAVRPSSLAASFLLPDVVGIVHLVTLGWVTLSIAGGLYIVGPLALRMPMPAGVLDWIACLLIVIGGSGVAAHAWLQTWDDVAMSGGMVLVGFALLGYRLWCGLRASTAPLPIRLHVGCAAANFLLTLLLGITIALDKTRGFLLVGPLQKLYAHAHLGVVGWAVMMAVGVGYRLLPMFLPASPPRPGATVPSLVLLQAGVLALVAAVLLAPGLLVAGAGLLLAGLLAFFVQVIAMLRSPRPRPAQLPRFDPGMIQARLALLWLVAAIALGLWLCFGEEPPFHWRAAYGVLGLLGFVGQFILGISMRLLPLFGWMRVWAGRDFAAVPPSPHHVPVPALQWSAVLSWGAGVPLLVAGVALPSETVIAAGAGLLLVGAAAATLNLLVAMVRVRRIPEAT